MTQIDIEFQIETIHTMLTMMATRLIAIERRQLLDKIDKVRKLKLYKVTKTNPSGVQKEMLDLTAGELGEILVNLTIGESVKVERLG
jgi:hypothetical protein